MTFEDFIKKYSALLQEAKRIPFFRYTPPTWPCYKRGAPLILVFSAHPDDEVLSMAPLAMRFRAEGSRVINVAMTLGSDESQHSRREEELEDACTFLGYELEIPFGREHRPVHARTRGSPVWTEWVQTVSTLTVRKCPHVIITHHQNDAHPSHERTSAIVREAIADSRWSGLLFEAEYWREMEEPNMMIEVSKENLVLLLKAISFHRGEIERNAFHCALPGKLRDNVRRSELVLGFGSEAPTMDFAVMYKRCVCHEGIIVSDTPQVLFASDPVRDVM